MPDILDDITSSPPVMVEDEEELHGLLSEAGISLAELLDDVLLGDKSVRNQRLVMNARKETFASGVLPRVIERVCQPPDMRIRGREHKQAAYELREWASATTANVLRKELAIHAKSTKVGDVECEVVNEDSLKGFTFDAITEEVQANAPTLYELLVKICESTRQEKNTQKDSKFCVTLFVNALAFQLLYKNNQMQKLICIYLKAKGVPKSCF
ncbi:hypothetical protein RSAG8_09392, partial [Rhizoctonia solani AG-8 WAC10335]